MHKQAKDSDTQKILDHLGDQTRMALGADRIITVVSFVDKEGTTHMVAASNIMAVSKTEAQIKMIQTLLHVLAGIGVELNLEFGYRNTQGGEWKVTDEPDESEELTAGVVEHANSN